MSLLREARVFGDCGHFVVRVLEPPDHATVTIAVSAYHTPIRRLCG